MSAPSALVAGAETTHPEKTEIAPSVPDPSSRDSPSDEDWGALNFFLIGLVAVLALVAVATASRHLHHSRTRDRVSRELTAAAAAVRGYMTLHQAAPADTVAGVVPAGMASLLAEVNWTVPTPAGGYYRLVNLNARESEGTPAPGTVMIAITAFPPSPPLTLSAADLLAIDRQIDDGNTATGDFRVGFGGWPVLWVRAP